MLGPLAITAIFAGAGSVIFQSAKSKALLNIADSTIYSKSLYRSERKEDRKRYIDLAIRIKKLKKMGLDISEIPSFKEFSNNKKKNRRKKRCNRRNRRRGICK